MFGVPINRPTNIFCDNGAIYANTKRLELTLTKKHHSIDYHPNQEEVTSGTVRVFKYHTSKNLADEFTKTMSAPSRDLILDHFMY